VQLNQTRTDPRRIDLITISQPFKERPLMPLKRRTRSIQLRTHGLPMQRTQMLLVLDRWSL